MIKKIYYFVSSPLDSRDTDRFGLEVLQQNGFDVEVWDFTAIINPERLAYIPPDQTNFSKCRLFFRKDEVLSEIKKLPTGSFVACILDYQFRSYAIFRALSKYRIPYGLYIYSYPSFKVKKKSIIRRLLNITPSMLAKYLFNTAPLKYLGIRPASTVLALGGEFIVPKSSVSKETKILCSHNFDYEIYLKVIKQSIKQDNKMGVFLDQYFPFHPDAVTSPLVAAKDYYPRVCSFFDHLERHYGVHIVIAAHPRSHYETRESLYGNRTIMRGRTGELVKESGFVIMHDSISINYAVLFRKPMIFITTDLLQKARKGTIELWARLFDKEPLNIDQSYEIDLDRELTVNERLYDEYKNKYIKTTGTDDTPAWQVFADFLKKQNAVGLQ